MSAQHFIAILIFTGTYAGIIFTRPPWLNIDRPSAAFFGAVAMIVFGVLSFNEAIKAIDFSKTRRRLLVIVVFVTGVASAFPVNDAETTFGFIE